MVRTITLNPVPLIVALLAVVVLCLGCCLWLIFLVFNLKKKYSRIMTGRDGLDMSELFCHYGDLFKEGSRRQDEVESRLVQLEKNSRCGIAGLALARFNAFGETGGDLSFSLALLNRNLDGAVITSIYGRDNSRVFAKLIREGRSEYDLSEEEKDALHEARKAIDAGWQIK